jgi:hypothetical protein
VSWHSNRDPHWMPERDLDPPCMTAEQEAEQEAAELVELGQEAFAVSEDIGALLDRYSDDWAAKWDELLAIRDALVKVRFDIIAALGQPR